MSVCAFQICKNFLRVHSGVEKVKYLDSVHWLVLTGDWENGCREDNQDFGFSVVVEDGEHFVKQGIRGDVECPVVCMRSRTESRSR